MAITLTNTLTGKEEPFVPIEGKKVRMYVCGPTVYGLTHIGNARPVVFFDVVRRFLEFRGYEVTYVSNFTDVDDKIINRAREEQTTSEAIAEKYKNEFLRDLKSMRVRSPDHTPTVTEHMSQIIKFIEGLVKNGSAYVASDGEVFFSVRSFKPYGKLSGKKIDELLVGARVDPNENKRDPLDFSLWKPQKLPDEPAWDSPWGKGRPGWHIECSVMSTCYLGESFDLHGGGMDLIHPHHENEIAQSEALTKKSFAKYWMHNNMLTMGTEKMSKSLGNIFLNRDFIKRYGAEVLKYMLLSGHYRSVIEFSEKRIRDTQAALHRVYCTIQKCQNPKWQEDTSGKATEEESHLESIGKEFSGLWQKAMENDFNTALALGYVFDYVRAVNAYLDRKGFKPTAQTKPLVDKFLSQMKEFSSILNLFGEDPGEFLQDLKQRACLEQSLSPEQIQNLIEKRNAARAAKDFKLADSIRAELLEKGIELKDTPTGTDWDVHF